MSEIDFEDLKYHRDVGFVPHASACLPDYFRPWHNLALQAAQLMKEKKIREEVAKLAQLDSSRLTEYADLRLAHLQLCVITSAYAWQDGKGNGPPSLPANVAVPFCDISDRLGLEAGNAGASYLINCEWLDKSKPYTFHNMGFLYQLPGGKMAADFWKVSTEIEASSAWFLPILVRLLDGTRDKDEVKVTQALKDAAAYVDDVTRLTKDYTNYIRPVEFYNEVLPFHAGYNIDSGYPEGMVYEGVKNRPRRQTLNQSAAQSPMFQILDVVMGITYSPDKNKMKETWRGVWAFPHRKLYDVIRDWPGSVKAMVKENKDSDMARAYDDVIRAISDFRTYHIQINARFVVNPTHKTKTDSNSSSIAWLIPMLREYREDLNKNKVLARK